LKSDLNVLHVYMFTTGETTDNNVIVEEVDFTEALDKLSPSVTEAELERYKTIRDQFNVTKNTKPVPKVDNTPPISLS